MICGITAMTVTLGRYWNTLSMAPIRAASSSSPIATLTDTAPRAPAGATHRASEEDTTEARKADPDPNLHAVRPATKPDPDKVTTAPPVTEPDDGCTSVTEPMSAYSTWMPL